MVTDGYDQRGRADIASPGRTHIMDGDYQGAICADAGPNPLFGGGWESAAGGGKAERASMQEDKWAR